jgi:hypothetical protein
MVLNWLWRPRIIYALASTLAALLCLARPVGSQQLVQVMTRHWSGQSVAPVYEGFDTNPDGTYNLWFGYMNRNFEEEPDVPVGPENTFEPGGDRGQPTHFAPRRHKDVFKVTVPKSFGTQKLVWKLTVHGKTESVPGSTNPIWEIDHRRTTRGGTDDNTDSNTPPVVAVRPASQSIATGGKATLTVTATDDGLPTKRSIVGVGAPEDGERRPQGPAGLSFEWFKYRGPGVVTFSPQEGMFASGSATTTTTASFTVPGEYWLQVLVDDGSGESAGNFGYHCCWTNTVVTATVHDAASEQK